MTMGILMIMTRARVTISEQLRSMHVLSMLLTLPQYSQQCYGRNIIMSIFYIREQRSVKIDYLANCLQIKVTPKSKAAQTPKPLHHLTELFHWECRTSILSKFRLHPPQWKEHYIQKLYQIN